MFDLLLDKDMKKVSFLLNDFEFFVKCILNGGCAGCSYFVKDLFDKENDGQSKEKKKSRFGKFMLLGSVVALAVSVGLWMMNSKYGGLTIKEIVGVGAGTFITFLLVYFFMWFLPEKVGAEE